MKVANIIEEARWGGPQARVVGVADELRKYGVETVVIHPDEDSERMVREIKKRDVSHIGTMMHRPSNPKRINYFIKYLIYFWIEIVNLRNIILEEDVDIVHCNGAIQIKSLIAAKLSNVPVVWHLNDTYAPTVVRLAVNLISFTIIDGFIASCRETQEYYIPKCVRDNLPIKTIHPPVNTRIFSPKVDVEETTINTDRQFTVVTIAKFTPRKDLRTFLDMVNIVSEEEKDVEFFVVGPIPNTKKGYAREIKRYSDEVAGENVCFVGEVDDPRTILKEADLFVCSSRSESGPMTVFEAMSMEVPVVSTDVGDVRFFLEQVNGISGSVVDVGNAEGLANQVLEYLDDEGLRKQAACNARNVAVQHLDTKQAAIKHKEIYKMVSK